MVKGSFRRTMIWLHTYSGLLLGWLCFIIFLTGTLSFYNTEITQWMQPEHRSETIADGHIQRAFSLLHEQGKDKKRWSIILPNARSNALQVTMANERSRRAKRTTLFLDVADFTQVMPRETQGADFFTDIHYSLMLDDFGEVIVVAIAIVMLVALFSGIFTHRRFFKDFFTLRFKRLTQALSDSHALVGIVTLPFFFVICLSGVIMSNNTTNPWSINHHFEQGKRQLVSTLETRFNNPKLTGVIGDPITDITPLLDVASKLWGSGKIKSIVFNGPYDVAGTITFIRQDEGTLSSSNQSLVFSAIDGHLLFEKNSDEESISLAFERVLIGLHEAEFAPPLLRFIMFLMGIGGTFLIASGLIIWLNKRLEKTKKRHRGHHIVQQLNIDVLAGLPLAIAGYFFANRLIPATLAYRAELEIVTFIVCWLAVIVCCHVKHIESLWPKLLLIMAGAYLTLPIIDVLIEPRYFLDALQFANFNYLGVNLLFISTAVMAFTLYLYTKRRA